MTRKENDEGSDQERTTRTVDTRKLLEAAGFLPEETSAERVANVEKATEPPPVTRVPVRTGGTMRGVGLRVQVRPPPAAKASAATAKQGGDRPDGVSAQRAAEPSFVRVLLEPIRKHFDRGDHDGAYREAEKVLLGRPDFVEARIYLERSREFLREMYLEKLGSGRVVLRPAMHPDEVQGLPLDPRAAFIFALVDGNATIDEILDVCGMAPVDALRLLHEMQERGVLMASG